DRDAHRHLDIEKRFYGNFAQVVDGRARHPILASHRARSFTVAGPDASLLVWLASADQFRANVVSEVSRRDTSFLQRGRIHSDDDWDVLPFVPAEGRRSRGVYLRFASRTGGSGSGLMRCCHGFEEAQTSFASKIRNHCRIGSIQGAVATWSVISMRNSNDS